MVLTVFSKTLLLFYGFPVVVIILLIIRLICQYFQ